jgi:hypothetical protein
MHNPAVFYKQGYFSLCCAFHPPRPPLSIFFSLLLQPPSQLVKTQRAKKLNIPKKQKKLSRCLITYNDTKTYGGMDFLDSVSNNTLISNFMKIRPVGAELLNADGRENMTKLIVAFRNFANVPKN